MKRWILLLLICPLVCAAQEPIEEEAQSAMRSEEDGQKLELRVEALEARKQHPLDLNKASREDLQELGLLTALQIEYYIRYRNLVGPFVNVYEMQAIPGWDEATCNRILPFVKVGGLEAKGGDRSVIDKAELLLKEGLRIPDTMSYPHHLSIRYRYQRGQRWQAGMLIEKDAGETWIDKKRGFDFMTAHLAIKTSGTLRRLILGDYTVDLGQGLLGWQSFGFGKSGAVMMIQRQSQTLQPYRGSAESNFNRGVGMVLGKSWMTLSMFASYRRESAHVEMNPEPHFTSIQTSGYHRTSSEKNDRATIAHLYSGARFQYEKGRVRVGLSGVYHYLGIPLQKGEQPYNHFFFSGRELAQQSVDYSWGIGKLHGFGEIAHDGQRDIGVLLGWLLAPDRNFDFSILYRRLPKTFQTFLGNAFTENALPQNEEGLYFGWICRPNPRWELHGYIDQFHFPWLKYRVDFPSHGSDLLMALDYKPEKGKTLSARLRVRRGIGNEEGEGLHTTNDIDRKSLRMEYRTQVRADRSFGSRLELLWRRTDQGKAEGFTMYGQWSLRLGRKIQVGWKVQYFETSDYETRVYTYEQDIFNGVSFPAFYGRGVRALVHVKYQPARKTTVWISLAGTAGGGLEVKKNNGQSLDYKSTELKIQIKRDL